MSGAGRDRIWLIGGTQESRELAHLLAQAHLPCTVSVTTESARSLYPDSPELLIWVGRLSEQSLSQFLQEQHIVAVLDASHPFAIEISQLAIEIAGRFQLPYLRYERPTTQTNIQSALSQVPFPCFTSFAALLSSGCLTGQRVLLTIGYRPLHLFQPWQQQATLFARILPSVIALEAALAAGFSNDRLIAVRPPVSADLERALWQQWQISMVVAKASGAQGGEDVKQRLATELGVPLLTIARPRLTYPCQTSDLTTALEFCYHWMPAPGSPN